MQGYRIYFDKVDRNWKMEKELSEVEHNWTDTEGWNAEYDSTMEHMATLNASMVTKLKDLKEGTFIMIKCKDCGEYFKMTFEDYNWFVERELFVPRRCKSCRHKRRENAEYDGRNDQSKKSRNAKRSRR